MSCFSRFVDSASVAAIAALLSQAGSREADVGHSSAYVCVLLALSLAKAGRKVSVTAWQ